MENAEEGNIEYKYKDISYDALLQQCNQGDVLKEKQQINCTPDGRKFV